MILEIIKKEIKKLIFLFSPLMAGIIVTSISLAILGPIMASKYEVYQDIILENTAFKGTNKSGEILNFWISMFLGVITVITIVYLQRKKIRDIINNKIKKSKNYDFLGFGLLIILVFLLFSTQKINFFYLVLIVVYFSTYIFGRKEIQKNKIIMLLFAIYFFIMSLKAIIDKLIKNYEIISQDRVYFLTGLFFLIVIYFLKKSQFKLLDKTILLFQIPIPFALLTYLTNKYTLDGVNQIKISFPKRYIGIILLTIVVLLIINIIQYKKMNKKNTGSLILFSSIITVFILHQYINPVFYHSGDFFHWGELTLNWQQIMDKEMILYKDYSGTSGLHGMVLGFFRNILFHGVNFSFLPSLAVTRMFWSILYASLCYLIVGANFSLIIGMMLFLPEYNRVNMLIIMILILSNPNLIKKRIQWIQIYVLLSILSLFYYPLNGIAGILGASFFTLIQIYLIYKEKSYLNILKSKSFWLLNILLIYPIILAIKYGFGLIKNILLLSSQSKLADGITVYGNSIPYEWFMNFLISTDLRNKLWYIFIFLIIISVVLIFIYLFCLNLLENEIILNKLKNPGNFILIFFIIVIPINYTFTTIRMDEGSIFGRTTSTMIVSITFGLLIYLYKYSNKVLTKNMRIILISLLIGLVTMIQDRPKGGYDVRNLSTPQKFGEEVKNIKRIYELNELENIVYVNGEKEGISKLGNGFMAKNKIEYITAIKEMKEKLIKSNEYFWPLWDRELIDIFDSKLPTKIDSPYLTKSLISARENLTSMKEKPIFIINLLNYQSYYTFRWMIDNGYVLYRYKEIDFWIRPDRYQETFGNIEEAKKNTIETFPYQEIGKIPYSLGNSMKTLNKIFSKERTLDIQNVTVEYNQIAKINKKKFKIINNLDPFFIIDLKENINGKDFDFIYVEILSNKSFKEIKDKKVGILWENQDYPMSGERMIRFDYGNGKFLIPVGIHPAWTYLNIKKIRLDFDEFGIGEEFEIKQIKFLKLNLDRKK